jgi:hypothetical protein
MASIDVFHSDPFTMIELTSAVERNPFLPTGIGELGLFTDNPIRTRALAVEQRKGQPTLIPTSPRGAPATERTTEKRAARVPCPVSAPPSCGGRPPGCRARKSGCWCRA